MLFRQAFLDGIRQGTITVAFRRWRRPSVRQGGTLLTPVGELQIAAVDRIHIDTISEADARRAGYGSREALLGELAQRSEGDLYRVELGRVRADPRVALRNAPLSGREETGKVLKRLKLLDARSRTGPWTTQTLELLRSHPGMRAADLCKLVGQEKDVFKLNVRKLKSLGLTESLEIGYRLSPRGAAMLAHLLEP